MLTYYCCGCRAQYPAAPKRCPRCKGRSFAGVNDDAPTMAVLLDDAPIVVPENLDGELAAAFAESERFRLATLSGSPYTRPAPPVAPEPANVPAPSFDDPARQSLPVFERAAVVLEGSERVEGWPGHLSDVMPADDAPPTPRDRPDER
jgi:hypothetical protein